MKQLLLCSWAYVSFQYDIHVHPQPNNKKHAERRTLFKMGKWLWHFPRPRFLPRLGLWECPCRAWLLGRQTPHFLRIHFCFLGSFELSNLFSRQNVWGIALTRNSFYPNWDVKVTLNLEDEESSSHCFTVSEQNYSTCLDQLFPASHGCKNCHHFQLLDDGLLTFWHYFVQSHCVHSFTEERDDFLGHVN